MKSLVYLLKISALIIVCSGCSTVFKQRQSYSHVVNFKEVQRYATKAKLAYGKRAEIHSDCEKASDVYVGKGKNKKLKWFVQSEHFPSNKVWLAIRGTDNWTNVMSDLTYIKKKDGLSGVYLHKGFANATKEIYDDIKKCFNKKSEIYISGHSLGGAAAGISMIWLKEEGYNVKFCYTFGQPKVTNSDGRRKYKNLPLLRFVHQGDPVPYLPPSTISTQINGNFRHFGDEVILLKDKYYVYLEEHDASRKNKNSLTNKASSRKLDSHRMDIYLSNIKSKLEEAVEQQWNINTAEVLPPGQIDRLFESVKAAPHLVISAN